MSGGRIVPAPVALTAPASVVLIVPTSVVLIVPALADRSVPAPAGRSTPAPVVLSGPALAPNVLPFVQNALLPVDRSCRALVPNAQVRVNVRAIPKDRKLRGHGLKHGRNKEPVKGKEQDQASMPGRNTEPVRSRAQGHSSGPGRSRVQGRSGPVLNRVQGRSNAAVASSGLGHKETAHRNEVRRHSSADATLTARQSLQPDTWSDATALCDSAVDQMLKGSGLLGLSLANVV